MNVTRSSSTTLIRYSRRSLNSKTPHYSYTFLALRKNTLDVELNGFKITAVDEDD